ncbi:MAG: sulfatase [Planctomycetota bacterium]|nr:sulfatase [Planctomycetota bacterium]
MEFYRTVLAVAVTAALTALPDDAQTDERNRYNVLFIAIDDLRPELACYGVGYAQSPNLDRLASQGALFTRHYVQVPTCGASRFALLTGRSPARSGVTGGNAAFYAGKSALAAEQLPGGQTMPELFRRSGYRTVCIGKISHTPDGRVFAYNGKGEGRPELPHAWNDLPTPFGAWKRGWGIFFAYAGGRHREDGMAHRDLMEFAAEKDEDLPDGQLAAAAIEHLQRFKEGGQRFFLGLGFFKPHLPFVATKQDWEAFAGTDIPPPPAGKIDSPFWHGSGEFYKYDAPFDKTRPLAPSSQHRARRAYLACVRYADRQVGKVIDALDKLGLAENTIVVVWGDHGWHLGEQQIWGKHSPFERAVRSVLMIRAPGVTSAGMKTPALTESIDLYPTLVDLCRPGFSRTQHPLDGKSLRSILAGTSKSVRPAALSYWRSAVSVRSDRYRLVAKTSGKAAQPVELYDLADDADSTKNLLRDRPDVVRRLMKYLPDRG